MSEPAVTGEQFYLGRQPILDRNQTLVAYELLFRSGEHNAAQFDDGARATATVIANAFSELSIAESLGQVRGFINVDEDFLFSDLLELLPREQIVLEILETVPPTPEVIERCRDLKADGYTLALDDVIQLSPDYADLIALVEVVKIDIQPLTENQLRSLVGQLKSWGKRLLAEKVDTAEQHALCIDLGFHYFQGYYFAKPKIIAGKKLEHSQLALMTLMGLLFSDADTAEIENVLKPEPGLTVNLLRMTNSVGAGTRVRITSLRHAITVLGRRQLQRWLQLLLYVSGNKTGADNPLLLMAATRGRLMELLADRMSTGKPGFPDQAFMVGIMSLMPSLMGMPMTEIVAPLAVSNDVKLALCEGRGQLGDLLKLAVATEMGEPAEVGPFLMRLPGLDPHTLNHCLTEALSWAGNINRERTDD